MKLNTGIGSVVHEGPMQTSRTPAGPLHQGGAGYLRSDKTELFLRATTMFAGEKNFYEDAHKHDQRAIRLARDLAIKDWAWMADFLPWLRQKANIRTMSIMLTVQAAHARVQSQAAKSCPCGKGDVQVCMLHKNELTTRQVVAAVLQRADEPAEMLQYWIATFGKPIAKPVKRGVADAMSRMGTQAKVMKWDKPAPMRMADVVELTKPKVRSVNGVKDPAQDFLYKHLITDRHDRKPYDPPRELQGINNRRDLSRMDPAGRHILAGKALNGEAAGVIPIRSAAAGQWEWVMSWLGEGNPKNALSKREQWSLVIPWMGYMALLRNLRNFDQIGLKDDQVKWICDKIADPYEIANSRQLPFRFLSAYKAAPSLKWGDALEKALNLCIPNIPTLSGRTLILVDMSGSMGNRMSGGGPRQDPSLRPTMMEAGALFGVAMALRNPDNTDLHGFATGQFKITNVSAGASVLKTVQMIINQVGKVGHGTDIENAIRKTYKGQDRVMIFTDMQTGMGENPYGYDIASSVPANVHVYGFNLAGYENSAIATGSYRHEMGGLTDHTFGLIPLLESGANGDWPWNLPDISMPIDDE